MYPEVITLQSILDMDTLELGYLFEELVRRNDNDLFMEAVHMRVRQLDQIDLCPAWRLAIELDRKDCIFVLEVITFENERPGLAAVVLLMCIEFKRKDLAIYWIDNGTPLNQARLNQNFPFPNAVFMKDIEFLDYLLQKGAKISGHNDGQLTALEAAISINDMEIVEWLLQRGADPNQLNYQSENSLYMALDTSMEMVELLISHEANTRVINSEGDTLMHCIARRVHLDNGLFAIAKYLVENQAPIDSQNNTDTRPLHFAAENGHLNLIELLINKGAYINAKDINGDTPLILSVKYSVPRTTEKLIIRKVRIDIENRAQKTALITSYESKYKEHTNLLLAAGADIFFWPLRKPFL